jgi:DNA excision repair protein ERCC-4
MHIAADPADGGVFTPVTIVVDDRERGGVDALLVKVDGVNVRRERLEVGDYCIGEEHALVERKTVRDFVYSIKSNHLFAQVDELRRSTQRPILIVEGDFYEYREISHEARRGAALFIARYWNVSFIQTKTVKETADWLATLAKHISCGAQEPRVPKAKDVAGQQQRMLEGIGGVGPGRAKKLLAHFGTPHRIVNATVEELASVVGPSIAKKVATFVRASGVDQTDVG